MRKSGYVAKSPNPATTFGVSLPSPVGGLNTRDPLARMDVVFAPQLTNWIPTPQGLSVREGYRVWSTDLPGYVETLMEYRSASGGDDKLFGISEGTVYDCTISGAATATSVTGLTNSRWEHVSFSTAGGQYLVMANGVDDTRHFNGSSWVTWTNVGAGTPSTPGQIKNVDPDVFSHVCVHQRRLWFVEGGTSSAWYTPVNSVGGEMTEFDFGPVFPRGGPLLVLGSWSINGGTGMQNNLVAISEAGDVAIYEGVDPDDAGAWRLAGTWSLAAPVGKRCLQQLAGDLLYLSRDGLVPLSQYLQNTSNEVAITNTIQPTLADLTFSQEGLFGFDIQHFLSRNLLIVNVPQIDPSRNIQFVMNTITKGWALFDGWPAQTWSLFGNDLFFGGDGEVCQAFYGYKDGAATDGTGGNVIQAAAQQAFTDFGKPGTLKRAVMARLNIVSAAGAPAILIGCNADYDPSPPTSVSASSPTGTSLWGTALWGSAVWSGALLTLNDWQSVQGLGYTLCITVAISAQAETIWVSTDWLLQGGGSIG